MARPLRVEVADTTYLVSARSLAPDALFGNATDYRVFLELLERSVCRYDWQLLAWCLSPGSYHLLLRIGERNLATGMRYLNSAYTLAHHQRHRRRGRLFKGRYEAIAVEPAVGLMEALQRLWLAPWRAGVATDADDWHWSSYPETMALRPAAECLAVAPLLQLLHDSPAQARALICAALEGHAQARGELPLPPRRCLGSQEFLSRLRASARRTRGQVASAASRPPSGLPFAAGDPAGRREAMLAAYASGGYTQREIANQFGVHAATVSRAVGFSRQRRQISTSTPH
jgi:hypothetical protein